MPRAEEAGDRLMRLIIPVVMLGLLVLLWAWYVVAYDVPHYILPSPSRVAQSLVNDWATLSSALLVTLKITFMALGLALAGGVGLAILMTQSRWVELAIYPYAVILQVTPIVAIAPLIVIYAPTTQVAVLICAFIVAFFPVLSNTTQGLKSTDHNLLNLFEMYGASRWQTLRYLKLPAALPYFLAGLKIAGGLALIAAVVAEFAAGSAGANSGLAYRLLESQFRLNIPRLFAALLLLSLTGVLIFALTSAVSHLLLRRWHESAIRREN
ncbi:ABC transporter permease [Pannonibacter sp.]|uniref:ABC transporter permease n=1 Tax=Pannonibacter sp. TaxID=1906786 RepID=UPI003F720D09